MGKRKVIVETISEFKVFGPDNTNGYVKVYRDYPTEIEYKDPKNIGGEAWDWAQANWPDFADEEQEFEVGGGRVRGTLRWICVIGVLNSKGKRTLPIAEVKWQPKKKYQTSSKKKSGVNSKDNLTVSFKSSSSPPKQKKKAKKRINTLDVTSVIGEKIKEALADD